MTEAEKRKQKLDSYHRHKYDESKKEKVPSNNHKQWLKQKENLEFLAKKAEKDKDYREQNAAHISQVKKEYREKNKELLKEQRSVKVFCECGKEVCKKDHLSFFSSKI